ncbi:MAG: DNA repair protein RecN [Spirochaetaceae bacterium]|jgi:DNA repair protein RecN (Recombination protein N)|nr:DNA repair protein RecN [Spirochaetaceae bacterium]
MLEELNIQNIALIEHAQLSFSDGFNVLTGETGAGKSILLGALGLLLGDKGDKSLIRTGASEAVVSGILRVKDSVELQEWKEKYDISIPDEQLIIRRTLKDNGRSSVYIQSQPVTVVALKELSSQLFDIHGQHQHQSLFHEENHRKLLDKYGGLEEEVAKFAELFKQASALREEIQQWESEQENLKRELELAEYALKEIEHAKLRPQEDAELMEQLKIMEQKQVLAQDYADFHDSMIEQGAILSRLKDQQNRVVRLSVLNPQVKDLQQRYENAYYEIEDVCLTIAQQMEDFESSPQEQQRVEDRLAQIHRLQQKYSPTLQGVIDHMEQCRVLLQNEEDSDLDKETKQKKSLELDKRVLELAKGISQKRATIAQELEKLVENHLKDLGMASGQFKIALQGRTNRVGQNSCGPYGMDHVEFLLSANRGEELQSLKKVASGGELSRIMLAIKSAFAKVDSIDTLVFDEIDSGIGGQVALSIGQHIQKLSLGKQIFSVTHLASIASFADNHFRVSKVEHQNRTITQVESLNKEQRVNEISRMLAGDSSRELSLKHAEELLAHHGK